MSNEKSILVVTPSLFSMGEGSGTQTFFETVKGYKRNGYNVTVLALTNDKHATSFIYHGIKIEYFRTPFKIFKERIDIFHSVFNYRIFKNNVLNTLAWRLYGILYVLYGTIRARELVMLNSYDLIYCYTSISIPIGSIISYLYEIPNISRILGIRYNYSKLNKFPNQLLIFWDYLQYKWPCEMLIMTDDGTVGDATALKMGVDPRKFRFWQNGISIHSVEHFDIHTVKNQLGIPAKRNIVLSVCRLAPEKRVDLLVESLPEVLIDIEDVHYLIIGDGRELNKLIEYCVKLNCSDHISFLGSIPNWEISRYYAISDICVSLSIYGTLVNSTIEAMGYGKSIIVANSGNIDEILSDGYNAIILENDSTQCLSKHIVDLLRNLDKRHHLSANAISTFKNNFIKWDKRMDMEIQQVESMIEEWSSLQ